ncbi:MAG TPA: NlpC/P60 family protein [Thermoleophilia bacterium]
MIRRLFTAVLAIATLIALLGVAAPASASPVSDKKARLREAQATLERVGTQVEKAVEYYNQAVTKFETTRNKIKVNQRLLTVAERNLAIANRQLAARAQSIYKAPETGFVDVVFAARSFDDLVTQFDLMQRLGNSDVDLVRSVTAYEREIKDRRIALRADEKTAAKLLEERRAQKSAILAQEAKMKALEGGLRSEIKTLLAQQAAAARAAAQQAAAASSGSGGVGRTTDGPPPPDPGGPGHPEVVAIAQRYLGIPYLWGGASPNTGFDCSGLVLYVYAQVGVQLSHGATDQQRASKPVPLNALQPGDLVFYGNASYSYHVAIYAGGGQTIEAARTGTLVRYGVVGAAWIGGRF